MKRFSVSRKYIVPALLGSTVVAGPVWAQADGAKKSGLEEVVVTAQRRNERLEEVPLSITAVSADALENSGVSSIESLGRISAGVQVNRAGSFSQPSIRGITTLTLGYGFENNVAVYVDGIYQADMISINTDLANISGVQILKGPQGTLYGRNATGGAIVIDTLDPGKEIEGKVQASVGSYDDQRVSAYVSSPLTDTLGFSLAGYSRDNDGYIKDIGTDPINKADDYDVAPLKSESVRFKLKWTPNDDLAVTLGQNYTYYLDARGISYRYPEHAASFLPAPPARATGEDEVSLNVIPDNGVRVHETTGKIVWDTGVGTLTSATGYTERNSHSVFDIDGSKANIATRAISTNIAQHSWQQSLDFYSDAIDRFDINVGAMYFRDRFDNDNVGSWGPTTIRTENFIALETDAMAAYVDVTWQATEHLFLTAGYRHSEEDKSVDLRQISYVVTPAVIPAVPPAAKDETFSDGTPRFVVRYELDPGSNVYASYTAGYRSGAFNPSPLPSPDLVVPVDQEEIEAYEIGYKTVMDTVRLSTAAFYYDYTDLQVGLTVPDPTNPASVIQQVFNAPEAEVMGAEVQVDYAPLDNLNLTANVAYTHARYTDFATAFGTGLNGATGTNTSVPAQSQDWTDQEMARAPLWTANAGADYTFDLVQGSTLLVSANLAYTDSFVPANLSLYGPLAGNGLENTQRYRQKGYTTINGQITWTDPTGHINIGVYGQNLTDKEYNMVVTGSAYGDFNQRAEPRTYGVKVGYNF